MVWIIVGILVFGYVLDRFLAVINIRHRPKQLPEALKVFYNEEQYQKSGRYQQADTTLSHLSSSWNLLLILIMILTGGFSLLLDWAMGFTEDEIIYSLIFFGVILLAADILNLPFQLYKIFVIEEKYGFNRMNARTFISDKIKGYLLTAFLGGSLLAMFILFYRFTGEYFWLYIWIVFALFSLLMTMFYSSWLLPLFNKLRPLEEGPLRTAISEYCAGVNFPLTEVMVMDGSKRSSKANAFFSGLGNSKKIVLFDTLINDYTEDELVAVLAHEVGHYKLKHTRSNVLIALLQSAIMFFIFSLFINRPELSQALGSEEGSLQLGLIAFSILYSPISMIMGILMSMLSRKFEFEADAFAKRTYNATSLASALKKLSVGHLSNLTPHPWYVFFYYSHPPLIQRLNKLES